MDAALSADVATLLAEYLHYSDLVEHLRALPEVARKLGTENSRDSGDVLAELELQMFDRLERLDGLGLYPTTTTAVDITVNGVPTALPELCREPTINALPDEGGPTGTEVSMETTIQEHGPERDQHNGLDESQETQHGGPGFFGIWIRPYLGYAGTFVAGAVCGVIGARYLGAPKEMTSLSA